MTGTETATSTIADGDPPTRDDLRRMMRTLEKTIRNTARWVLIAFAIPGLVTALAVLFGGPPPPLGLTLEGRIWSAIVTFCVGGLSFGLAARRILMKDVRGVAPLIASAPIYRGHVVRLRRRLGRSATAHLVVRWETSTGTYHASFDSLELERRVEPRIFVISDGGRRVGVVVNGKLYGAKRHGALFAFLSAERRL